MKPENKARVTITRRGTIRGEGVIAISITDHASDINVCDVVMSLSEFSECVTGLAGSRGEFRNIANLYSAARYGKTKIVERVYCEKVDSIKKKDVSESVRAHFNDNYADEWELWSDGTGSQQHGEKHQYIICKYVDRSEEVEEMEKTQ